jgi:L-cysteate sulfo-lyase
MNDALRIQALAQFANFPHLHLGFYPTPIEEVWRFRQALGDNAPRIFIKRDDYTGAGFGGNKVRKLDYVLAQALEERIDTVITVGGEKSNHCRATAAMCARVGLRCILVLNVALQNLEVLKPASLAVDELVGAEIYRVTSREERQVTMQTIAEKLRSEGQRVLEIPLGASIPLGALGYVQAAQEAAGQLETRGVRVTHMFHSSSSGGTQAGLIAGSQLCSLHDAQIIGVSPDDAGEAIAAEVQEIIQGLNHLLDLPTNTFNDKATTLDEYIGDGYGIASPESTEALALMAQTEGIILDPVYTAKAMAALVDWTRQGKLTGEDTVLFWHTGGQLALFYSH